jgi:hypothetical protein
MRNPAALVVLMVLVQGFAACDGSRSSMPAAPSAVRQPTPPVGSTGVLRVFVDQVSGFSTSDLRDAQEQIVQVNTDNEHLDH